MFIGLTACTAAKSPLKNEGAATFAILPGTVRASAELGKATKESFGRAKTQRLHFTVCLQSLATGESVAQGTAFAILDGTGGRIDRKTDPSGCLNWDEDHDVSPIAPERNVRVQRQIKALGNHTGLATLTFNVKPWLEGGIAVQSALNNEKFADAIDVSNDAGGFGFSEKFPTEDRAAVAKSADAATRRTDDNTHFEFTDNQINFNFVKVSQDRDFRVDRYLNLAIPYQFNFSVRPLIARRSFSGTMRSDPLTEGRVKLTFVFFASGSKDLNEDDRYLTSFEWEGEVASNGMLTGSFVYTYPHVLFASGRQTVLIEISAPDHSGIEPRTYSGSFPWIDQRGGINLLADGRDAVKIRVDSERERAEREKSRPSPLQEFLAQRQPSVIDIDQFPTEDVRQEQFNAFTTFPRALQMRETMKGILLGRETAAKALLTREELTYALEHDNLSTRGYAKGGGSVENKLCRAYLYANVGPMFANPLRNFRTEYVTAIHDGNEEWTRQICNETRAHMNIEQLDFIEELGSPVPRAVEMITYGNQDFAIAYGKDHTTTNMIGFGFKPSLGVFGFDLATSSSLNESRRSNWGQSQTMAIDRASLEVQARVRHCVLVTPLDQWMPKTPWFTCAKDVSKLAWRPERYFYYSQIFSGNHSPLIDPNKAQVSLKMLVRGGFHQKRIMVRLSETDFSQTGFEVFVKARAPDMGSFDTLGPVDGMTEQSAPGAILRN